MPNLKYTDHQLDLLFTGIYIGSVNPYNLPIHLYRETAAVLMRGLDKGRKIKHAADDHDKELVRDLSTNIYHFAASKTFTQVLEFQSLMTENNSRVALDVFKTNALQKWNDYNVTYLNTEYMTTITSSISAMNWNYAQQNKELFPRLRSVAVLDAHTSDMCRRMHGVIADLDDPIWNHNVSPRHYQCRCYEERIDAFEPVKSTGQSQKNYVEKMNDQEMNPVFKMNPGKDREIFSTKGPSKHPYYVVSSQFKNLAQHNFNLPIPQAK